MASTQQDVEQLVGNEYAAGFYTDIEQDQLPPGLNEDLGWHDATAPQTGARPVARRHGIADHHLDRGVGDDRRVGIPPARHHRPRGRARATVQPPLAPSSAG